VARLCDDPASLLTLYRRLIELRRCHSTLSVGYYRQVLRRDNVLGFTRFFTENAAPMFVFLNFSQDARKVDLPENISYRLLLSTFLDRDGEEIRSSFTLRSCEGIIFAAA